MKATSERRIVVLWPQPANIAKHLNRKRSEQGRLALKLPACPEGLVERVSL